MGMEVNTKLINKLKTYVGNLIFINSSSYDSTYGFMSPVMNIQIQNDMMLVNNLIYKLEHQYPQEKFTKEELEILKKFE